MADAYRQILDLVIAAVTGLPTTGANVFEDPTHALASGKIPATVVEPVRDPAEGLGESHEDSYLEQHTFRVRITGITTSPAERDIVVAEQKNAILVNAELAERTSRRRYVTTEFDRTGEGAKSYFGSGIEFDIEYQVLNTEPDVLR